MFVFPARRPRGWGHPGRVTLLSLRGGLLNPQLVYGDNINLIGLQATPFKGGWVSVDRLEQGTAGEWSAGLLLDYQNMPLTLRRHSDGAVLREAVNGQFIGHWMASVSLASWMEMGIVLPTVFYQGGAGIAPDESVGVGGLGDPKLHTRWMLICLLYTSDAADE